MGAPDTSVKPATVLFACIQNAGRSQMAAAFFNALADPARARAVSGGTAPAARVHPEVVTAMAEVGIALAGVRPAPLEEALAAGPDWLVTMGCGDACPTVVGVRREEWQLPDPHRQPPERVREIRDAIRARVVRMIATHAWARTVEGVAVVFDMDGVLVDSGDAHRRAWRRLGDEVGTPFTDALFARTFGQRNANIVPAWLGDVPAERVIELGVRKETLYRELVRAGAARPYACVAGVLAALRAGGARLAVASSGPRENVALLVERLGVGGLLGATVSSEDVRRGKPDPEAFLRAAERLGLVPVRCAVVEDSVHGIEAARRAGMLAIAVLTSTDREALAAAGAEVFVPEVADLDVGDVLERLAGRDDGRAAR